ncbi:MAG: tetratricopeptide repeat protein [Deltaproteobacteria bacterium]|nr:tetratricopeptide repeat protein [Deltaproteobacteria bacterium]
MTSRLLLLVALVPRPLAAQPALATELVRASRLLDAWDVEEAERIVEQAAEGAPADPDLLYLRSRVRFHRGRYADALADVRSAIARRRTREDWKSFRDLVESTVAVTRDFVQTATADRRFLIRTNAADAVLVPLLEETLAAAASEVGSDLGLVPSGPIVVEVLPDAEALARVSTLTLAEIRASGTIALCKWNRLMITSPRALVRGYPWRDTVCHEYTHLVISRATAGTAPIWFHEGLAKLEERRWSPQASIGVDPALAYLLDRAAQSGALIPFERMHPSLAKLPTQEQAALAFAEVGSLLRFVQRRAGMEGIRAALGRMRAGEDAQTAVARAMRTSWYRVVESWRADIRARRGPPPSAARVLALRFREGGGDPDDTSDIEAERARRYVRLGDLLWERSRPAAAAVEYERAARVTPEDPIVANRAARALLETGRPAQVPALVARSLALYPDFPQSHVHLAVAHAAAGDRAAAIRSFERALGLNPFDPNVRCALEQLYRDAGEAELAERERQACEATR